MIAGAGGERDFAQRDPPPRGKVHGLVVLHDPAGRPELGIDLPAGELFGIEVRHRPEKWSQFHPGAGRSEARSVVPVRRRICLLPWEISTSSRGEVTPSLWGRCARAKGTMRPVLDLWRVDVIAPISDLIIELTWRIGTKPGHVRYRSAGRRPFCDPDRSQS